MFRLIGHIVQSLKDDPSNNSQRNESPRHAAHGSPLIHQTYTPTYTTPRGYYIAPQRQTCCQRKSERRAARQMRKAERHMLRAEHAAQRSAGRGCGRSRRNHLGPVVGVSAPVTQHQQPAMSSHRSGNAASSSYYYQQQRQQPEVPAPAPQQTGWAPEDAPPPAYEEVERGNTAGGSGKR